MLFLSGHAHLCRRRFSAMPANKYALLRYRIIDRSIRNSSYPSKEDLRAACEEALYGSSGEHISMSTIDKDIWAMRNESELGYYAPIKFSKTYSGYFYEDPDFSIAEVPLTDDDLDAIRAAAETLYQFKEIPLFSQFDSAIEKILDRMKISAADAQKHEHEIIQFERLAGYKGSEFLQPLFSACSENTIVELTYKKFGTEEESGYKFAPYIIKEYRNRWYVIGKEVNKGGLRTFSLDRITSLYTTSEKFDRGDDFDSKRFFKHAVGITVTDEAPEEVVITFTDRIAPYIMTQPLHPSQQVEKVDGGGLRISVHVLVTVELISTILGYGQDAEVVRPAHLRSKVKKALTKCLDQYGSRG